MEENDAWLRFSREEYQLQAIVIHLYLFIYLYLTNNLTNLQFVKKRETSYSQNKNCCGNGKYNCRVKKMNLFITSNCGLAQS